MVVGRERGRRPPNDCSLPHRTVPYNIYSEQFIEQDTKWIPGSCRTAIPRVAAARPQDGCEGSAWVVSHTKEDRG